MARKMKLFSIVLMLSMFLLVACGVAWGEQIDKKGWPDYMRMAAAGPGGAWYPMAAQMCAIVERNLGVSTAVQPGGGIANARAVNSGDAEAGWTQSSTAYDAFHGVGPFEKDNMKYDNIRHLLSVSPQGAHFVVRVDSDITSISEFKGKRIGLLQVGSAVNEYAEILFKIYGFTLEDLKTVSYLSYSEGPGMLADGNVDALVMQGTHPYSPLAEIDFNPGFRLLGIEKEILDKFFATNPSLIPVTIKKGTYNNMDKDVVTMGNYNAVIVNKNLSETFVYEMTKNIFENLELMFDASATARDWLRLETALVGEDIPVHPGALKYYKEQGIIK